MSDLLFSYMGEDGSVAKKCHRKSFFFLEKKTCSKGENSSLLNLMWFCFIAEIRFFLHSSPTQKTSCTIFVVEFWMFFSLAIVSKCLVTLQITYIYIYISRTELAPKGIPAKSIVIGILFIFVNKTVSFIFHNTKKSAQWKCYPNQLNLMQFVSILDIYTRLRFVKMYVI